MIRYSVEWLGLVAILYGLFLLAEWSQPAIDQVAQWLWSGTP